MIFFVQKITRTRFLKRWLSLIQDYGITQNVSPSNARQSKAKQLSNILTLQPTKDLLNQSFLVLGFFLSKTFFFYLSISAICFCSISFFFSELLGLNTVRDNTLLDYWLQFTISSKLMLTWKSKILIWPGVFR